MLCGGRKPINPKKHQPGDQKYTQYSKNYLTSCRYYHQLGDEMYNPYSNIIWQLAIHAINLVMNVQPVLSFMPPTRWSKVRPVLQNYSVTCRYYHQPGDQKYTQYSKIIRQPAAITTNQVIKKYVQYSKNYLATCRYYHQPGDQKYAQYSKIIR